MICTNDWYCFSSVLDKNTCDKIIALGGNDFHAGKVLLNKGPTEEERNHGLNEVFGIDEQWRSSDLKWIDEKWVYNLITPFMHKANSNSGWKFDIETVEEVQLTRYQEGDFYSWHVDGTSDSLSTYNTPDNKFKNGYVKKISMTILLNDDFDGGEFQFSSSRKEKINISTPELKTGSIIFFPPWMEHRVKPIIKGTRYSLVGWFLGYPFK